MNFAEIARGIGNVLLVMLLAGVVAYVGDRVGHQVGRRRLSIFNIRPRYTSTIVAIATGVVIALVVTLVAIFASHEVKTAFFQLSSINAQIDRLQAKERMLEAKVNNGHLVVPVDALMVPYARIISRNSTAASRFATIQDYYANAVRYVNAMYPRLGLRPYESPPDIDKKLHTLADAISTNAQQSQANIMLSVTSDQNLFQNDQIHFELNAIPDVRFFEKGQAIFTLRIPGASGVSAANAVGQLEGAVSAVARKLNIPEYLAGSVTAEQLLPSAGEMQRMLAKKGTFLLTAYAAEDVYPHLGGIPIDIALTPQPQ